MLSKRDNRMPAPGLCGLLNQRVCTISALACSILAAVSTASGQLLLPPPAPEIPADLPIAAILYDAQQLASQRSLSINELRVALQQRGVQLRDDGKVHVEVVGPKGAIAVRADFLAPFGGEISSTWRRRADTWIPIDRLAAVARALPAGYSLEWPHLSLDAVIGEGPAAVNSTSYQN